MVSTRRLALQQQAQQGDNDLWLPTGVSHSDIVLSRALEPLLENVSTWVNDCMSFKETDKEIEDSVYRYTSELHRPSFVEVVYRFTKECDNFA